MVSLGPSSFPAPDGRIAGVVFDLHSTLVDQGDPAAWLAAGWARAGRAGAPAETLGQQRAAALAGWLDRVWEHARVIDPDNRRDLSPDLHRQVFERVAAEQPDLDGALAKALYDTMLDCWVPYDDALPVLRALRDHGVRTGLLSNVGVDVTPVLERGGLLAHLDAVVLSYQVELAKPDPAIFSLALERLGVPAARALMVGDSWRDDGAAAAIGVPTLLLPRTSGPTHGLDRVLRLVGIAA